MEQTANRNNNRVNPAPPQADPNTPIDPQTADEDRRRSIEPKTRSRVHPLETANFVSKLFIWWISEVIKISKRTPWQQNMHYDLPEKEEVTKLTSKFFRIFAQKKDLSGTIWALYKSYFIEVILVMLVLPIYTFSSAVFTSDVISSIKNKIDLRDPAKLRAIILELLLIAFITVSTQIIQNFYIFRVNRFSLRIRSAVLAKLQDKIMRFSTLNSTYFTEGNITNLLQVDCKRLTTFFEDFLLTVQSLFATIVGITYMSFILGFVPTMFFVSPPLAGIFVYVCCYYFRDRFTRSMLFFKDKRMAYFRNVLQNVEYVKSRALENFYSIELFKRREKELKEQMKIILAMAIGSITDWCTDPLSSVFIVLYYTYFFKDENLDPEKFFAAFFILNLLKKPFYVFVFRINRLIGVRVSLRRISRFMVSRDVEAGRIEEIGAGEVVAMRIENGGFRWKNNEDAFLKNDLDKLKEREEVREGLRRTIRDSIGRRGGSEGPGRAEKASTGVGTRNGLRADLEDKLDFREGEGAGGGVQEAENLLENQNLDNFLEGEFFLRNVNFELKRGEIMVVFGESSSGKSSLLHAMMGEMIPNSKKTVVQKQGKIAFLGQSRWLIGDTVRENICLGKDFDERWMQEALESSQLIHDLKNLNDGLETVMGDTSDTVSGGQRARIALSRCFYQK